MAMVSIHIRLNEALYLRDPQLTKLGRKIIEKGIILIDELGLEKFTFKKLAKEIDSTEASVYRYFENKHKLLIYLVSWYWEWIKFQIEYHSMNITDPLERLRIIIKVLVESAQTRSGIDFVNEEALHRIVIAEATKSYHTKDVDTENQAGLFWNFKSLCGLVSNCFADLNPNYPYPRALATTIIEMAQHHLFYAAHLPSLTDIKVSDEPKENLKAMLEFMTLKLLDKI
jgi:AcrR family transcriptional regulator